MRSSAHVRSKMSGAIRWALTPLAVAVLGLVLATGSAIASTVYLNAPFADRGLEPTEFSPNKGPEGTGAFSVPGLAYVRGVKWASWGGPQATGIGGVRLLVDKTTASPATITLGGLETCDGVPVYSTYSIALAPGAKQPRFWPTGSTGSFPCEINAGSYIPGSHLARRPEAQGGCVFHGLEIHNQYAPALSWAPYIYEPPEVNWTPRLPRGSAYTGFCRTRWGHWGSPVARATTVLRNGTRQWAAALELSRPTWCSQLGVAYSRLRMTLYGRGEPIPSHGFSSNISVAEADHLEGEVGKQGLSKHTYTQNACSPGA